ncbi:MAG: uroporphyrinogen decarboxylase family protein [Sedimentisphaeraceae bacterium JB056]
MNSKERINAIFNNEPTDRVGFWIGHPADDTKLIYARELGIDIGDYKIPDKSESHGLLATNIDILDVKLAAALESDLFWLSPEIMTGTWKHPEGKPMFDVTGGKDYNSLSQPGIFANTDSVSEIEDFEWPDPQYLDFTNAVALLDEVKKESLAVAGGMWMSFFHVLCDFFGMENYFMKMYTHPEVVEAATEKIISFYLEANRRCLDLMADDIDVLFFGNDLGSQLDLLISPDACSRFIIPGYKRIVAQAKEFNLRVMLHSCGSIGRIIPDLIDIGIDALHPLQAKAACMDAVTLKEQFDESIVFVGGVDTQELLPFGTAEQVYEEVCRLKEVFGPRYIVSPSHEALLSNVSLKNVLAMRDAVFANENCTVSV